MQCTIASKRAFSKSTLYAMYRLRAEVFRRRKGWNIPLIGDLEIDGYDALDPYYMIMHSKDETVVWGCWRLLPTTGHYMLKDTFGYLLNGRVAPFAEDIWEISRFAISSGDRQSQRFSDTSFNAIRELVRCGIQRSLRSYVTVTTVGVERMLARANINMRRLGSPQIIGVERSVALEIFLCEKTLCAVGE